MNNLPNTNAQSDPMLTETVSVRLSAEERSALADIAQRDDRTVSYVVRARLREFLRHQQWSV